jgi:hypothetical protein
MAIAAGADHALALFARAVVASAPHVIDHLVALVAQQLNLERARRIGDREPAALSISMRCVIVISSPHSSMKSWRYK